MHPSILGAGLLAASVAVVAAEGTAGAPATCPAAGAAVLERFISADCPACWAAPGPAALQPGGWLFDWIVPTPQGDAAALAAAALLDAGERAQRTGRAPAPAAHGAPAVPSEPAAQATPNAATLAWVQRSRLAPAGAVQLRVIAGPAWNGYFALQFEVRGALPAGATGWLALVEILPAGTDGSPLARELVRSVAGPLPLQALVPGQSLDHLHALRWPESAQPLRLQARAWVESAGGALLAVASERCPQR